MADGAIWSQRVLILRHGERQDHAPDAPPDFDPPLTSAGKAAIPAVAARIQKLLGAAAARNAVVLVSPFKRCLETASGLQSAAVGSDSSYVVDNGVCEVYGPIRIKHPERQLAQGRRALPAMPQWGETLSEASDRFVASFLRIADAYAPAASTFTCTTESESNHNADTPEAVTNRMRLPARHGDSARAAATSQSPLMDSCSTVSEGRDVIIVTHGDALSAVLNHFYPSRTVYEAEYLSFLIMKRYGVGNNVFHLDDSVGVHWILDGLDEEPSDPIWRAYRDSAAHPLPATLEYGYGGYAMPDVDDFSDEGEDAGEAVVPRSSVRRVKSRAPDEAHRASVTVRAPREFAVNPRAAQPMPPTPHPTPMTTTTTTSTTGVSPSEFPASPKAGTTGRGGRTVTSPTAPTVVSPPTPGKTPRKKSSSGAAHPKGSEGCERLYSPDRTPPQSSVHDQSRLGASAKAPPESYGQPNHDSHRREGDGDDDVNRGTLPREQMASEPAVFADLGGTSVQAHHHDVTCLSLLKTSLPLRRSCALRLLGCVTQVLMYAAVPSPLAATCYFLAVLVVEVVQGLVLYLSTLSARASRVRQCVEYLYCCAQCDEHAHDEHDSPEASRYYRATSVSTPGSTARRDEPTAHATMHDSQTGIPDFVEGHALHNTPTQTESPSRRSLLSMVARHFAATVLKLACVCLLGVAFGTGQSDTQAALSARVSVVVFVFLVYVALNMARGILDEKAETAWPSHGRVPSTR